MKKTFRINNKRTITGLVPSIPADDACLIGEEYSILHEETMEVHKTRKDFEKIVNSNTYDDLKDLAKTEKGMFGLHQPTGQDLEIDDDEVFETPEFQEFFANIYDKMKKTADKKKAEASAPTVKEEKENADK